MWSHHLGMEELLSPRLYLYMHEMNFVFFPIVQLPPPDPLTPTAALSVFGSFLLLVYLLQVSGSCAFPPLPGSFHGWDVSGLLLKSRNVTSFGLSWTCNCISYLCYNLLGLPLCFYLPHCYHMSTIHAGSWLNPRRALAYSSEVPGARFSPRPLCLDRLWSGRSCVHRQLEEQIILPGLCLLSLPITGGSSSFNSVNKTLWSGFCQKLPPHSRMQALLFKAVDPH